MSGSWDLYYNTRNPLAYETTGWINLIANYKTYFPVSNLQFAFSGNQSYLPNYTDIKQTLDIFEKVGMTQNVLSLYGDWSSNAGLIGSLNFKNKWIELLATLKFDERVAGIQIFGEPQTPFIVSTMNVRQAMFWIADLIQYLNDNVRDDITYIFPDFFMCFPVTEAGTKEKTDIILETGIHNLDNVLIDVIHPYYNENAYLDWNMTPELKVKAYRVRCIDYPLEKFGAEKIVCGETFAWQEENHTEEIQKRWIKAILTEFHNINMGYNLHAMYGNKIKWDWTFEAIDLVEPPQPPPQYVDTNITYWQIVPDQVKPMQNFKIEGFLFRNNIEENLSDSQIVDNEEVLIQYIANVDWINFAKATTKFDSERGYHGFFSITGSFPSQVQLTKFPFRVFYNGNSTKRLNPCWTETRYLEVYQDQPTPEPPPPEPQPEPEPAHCIFGESLSGTVLSGSLPAIRVFRDRCLPEKIKNDYYYVSRYLAPKIRRFRRMIHLF